MSQNIKYVEYPYLLSKDRPAGLSASTFVVDRSVLLDVGGWSPGIFHLDLPELLTKLGISGKMILICAPPTVWYRIHSANSIHSVQPFLEAIRVVLAKESAGKYPGGRRYWFERSAWFGGMIFFWTKRAMREGLYRNAAGLLVSGWWMILLGTIRRCATWLRGRRRVELMELSRQ